MLKKHSPKVLIFILFSLFFSISSLAQKNIYAGIEIGRRTIKVSVLDVSNIKKADYKIIYYSNDEGLSFAKHITATGELTQEDINKAGLIVFTQLTKIRAQFKIPEENIFLVASSVFGSARNVDALKNKISTLTNKELDIINVDEEAKILVKGSIPPVDYSNALHLDIGAASTKGGYIDELQDGKLEFIPLELDFGTMSLTDAVKKTVANQSQASDMSVYQEKSFDFNPIVRKKIKDMLDANPLLLKKEKIYLSGGAVWAFTTLYYNENTKDHYLPIKLEDVIDYDAVLKNNFNKFNTLAKTNTEAARVLNIYDQKYLISANNILQACVESIPNLEKKKIYFVKEGPITWLISYIADRSKKVNTNF
ncbi:MULTISPECIES: exopolyphosphatase [unclassified Flavobacterium]|uniref:Ppx/GppA phosphatase family protein n=1 Tax=unclassified Flavobacterium TaxID=196869 RepID=UPI00201F73C0|nr:MULTISPECIES: exopolyphosphatase [unclassified Flavobacterium]URC14582.1 exopolyphosphatase [Flavobacterium sp. B183]